MKGLATTGEVARYLNVRPNTLDHWASDGRGPRFTRINGRRRYDWSDVRALAYEAPQTDRPHWTCGHCGESANTRARLIVSIDQAALTGDADWGILHDDCPAPNLPNPYEIPVERADTWLKLTGWVAHLWEKDWIHQTNLDDLLRKAGAR